MADVIKVTAADINELLACGIVCDDDPTVPGWYVFMEAGTYGPFPTQSDAWSFYRVS